jgi:hypothetical protein
MPVRPSSLVFLAVVVMALGCSDHLTDQPLPGLPPETFVALRPDGTMRATVSVQHIQWWAVDPDGFVAEYLWSFDSLRWSSTTKNDSLFALSLNGLDTTYSFFVKAVDNAGNIDPTPASIRYPIKNSPPTISFVLNSDVPESTFTVASFQWTVRDIDGDASIQSIFYAVDDTLNPSSWHRLTGTSRLVTLRKSDGLTEGNHVFYARAQDVAGVFSTTVRMPRDTTRRWYVREPRGDFLVVDDYGPLDGAQAFYSGVFDTLMNGRLRTRDIFDIKLGATSSSRGKLVPPLVNPDFVETLKLFKYVLWYGDNSPSLDIGQVSLPEFLKSGGKVLFTTGFPDGPLDLTGLVPFAPIDNVEPSRIAPILLPRDTLVSLDPSYPALLRDDAFAIYTFPRGLLPKVNARPLYRMAVIPPRLAGNHIMGVKDADQASFVLISGFLHRFGTPPDNAAAFFRRVFKGEFGVQ